MKVMIVNIVNFDMKLNPNLYEGGSGGNFTHPLAPLLVFP